MPTLSELSHKGEALLAAHVGGFSNPPALAAFRALANEMRSVPHYHASEKITSMQYWAERLFSARKHRKYDANGGGDGAGFVRQMMMQDLMVMRDIERRYSNPAA